MQILYLLLAKRYWFLTSENLIWISNSFLEEERHCFCQLRIGMSQVPSDFPTSLLMSTLTSAVLWKSLFGNAARRTPPPSSSWSIPCLTQWTNLLLLTVLFVKRKRQSFWVSVCLSSGKSWKHCSGWASPARSRGGSVVLCFFTKSEVVIWRLPK